MFVLFDGGKTGRLCCFFFDRRPAVALIWIGQNCLDEAYVYGASKRYRVRLYRDQHLPPGGHLCYIYSDEQEHARTMAQFVESGLASGEKVAYLADVLSREELEQYIAKLGVNFPADLRPGQLIVPPAEETYCPDGTFQPERMIETWHSMYRQSVDEGFPGIRVTGETGWTCNEHPGLDRWFEYESMLNIVVEDVPFSSIICQYDANRLSGVNLYEVLRVHPLMIVGGQILHNPYYEVPAQYLARRRASA